MSNRPGAEAGPPFPQSRIERALHLRALPEKGTEVFVNDRPLWTPQWGRGIFGGAIIAQSLAAAQATTPSTFSVHSMHCHFIDAANNETMIEYKVQQMRAGRTLITRLVQAWQKKSCIFTATVSFMREGSPKKMIEHHVPMPSDLSPPPEILEDTTLLSKANQTDEDRPCDCVRCPASRSGRPDARKLRHWIRARGHISDCLPNAPKHQNVVGSGNNHQAHAMALAYMTDTYFIGTVARVHDASRFTDKRVVESAFATFEGTDDQRAVKQRFFANLAEEEIDENKDATANDKTVHMMVSLDHTIFFHNSGTFRADQWMLVEMDTPWAGRERGLVVQRIWSQGGTLIATCMQEGLVRLFQEEKEEKKEKSHL